jgi:hypothetical protein
MPVGFRRIKQKGRPLASIVNLKSSIVEVGAEENCLAHALIIAITRLNYDPNYKALRQGRKIRPVVDQLLETSINLKNGAGLAELTKFQEHFHEYRIVVYSGLNCERIMYQGHFDSDKCINLLFDEVTQHYHFIAKLQGPWLNNVFVTAVTKNVDMARNTLAKTSSGCMLSPPCISAGPRIPYDLCNRHFRNRTR